MKPEDATQAAAYATEQEDVAVQQVQYVKRIRTAVQDYVSNLLSYVLPILSVI